MKMIYALFRTSENCKVGWYHYHMCFRTYYILQCSFILRPTFHQKHLLVATPLQFLFSSDHFCWEIVPLGCLRDQFQIAWLRMAVQRGPSGVVHEIVLRYWGEMSSRVSKRKSQSAHTLLFLVGIDYTTPMPFAPQARWPLFFDTL